MTSRAFPILAVALLVVSGCSAAHVVSQWRDPEYTTPLDVKRIMVVGVSKQAGIRRKFEDVLVERLKEEGIDAVQSYLYIPEDGPVPEDRLQDAVRRANADATLVTRLVRVERQTEVVPGYYSPPVRPGWYPWYTDAWTGYYEPPRVYQRDVYISETSLWDLKRNRMVWTGTVKTDAIDNVDKAIEQYVKTVVKALERDRVLVTT